VGRWRTVGPFDLVPFHFGHWSTQDCSLSPLCFPDEIPVWSRAELEEPRARIDSPVSGRGMPSLRTEQLDPVHARMEPWASVQVRVDVTVRHTKCLDISRLYR
jgi:hypothetical protein